ncbi:MAG TPA: aminoglycoside phosphotransferase family protein [Actinomycetaceae bacterium]|nr:aminoglycoside phosphotransferase family protein [Actinomycetaceae bacterium]
MSELEQVELLTGDGAAELLVKALGTEGATILDWRVDALHHRPAAGVSAGYELSVRAADGSESSQYVCATTSKLTRRDTPGLVRLDHVDGYVRVYMWRHPHDPELPMLAPACDTESMSRLMAEPVTPVMIAYRPTRRCVLRLDGRAGPLAFVKVVRPTVTEKLVSRHRMLAEGGVPAPVVLHSEPTGLVVLSVATGIPMANYLASGLPDPVATFDATHAVLAALPEEMMALPAHPAWAERVEYYAHAAATALPERSAEAHELAQSVAAMMASSDPGPRTTTHGDFYEANVFMTGPEQVSSILDVDSMGPGHRVDDVACLLGHVSVLPHLAPQVYPHVSATLELWWRRAQEDYDSRALAARAAAVTLSLVAGAKKPNGDDWRPDADGRLDEALAWIGRGS